MLSCWKKLYRKGIVSIISYYCVAEPLQLFTLMEEALYLLHVCIRPSAMIADKYALTQLILFFV